jgi:hypothetical protein
MPGVALYPAPQFIRIVLMTNASLGISPANFLSIDKIGGPNVDSLLPWRDEIRQLLAALDNFICLD